jgi:hypothetical protein
VYVKACYRVCESVVRCTRYVCIVLLEVQSFEIKIVLTKEPMFVNQLRKHFVFIETKQENNEIKTTLVYLKKVSQS